MSCVRLTGPYRYLIYVTPDYAIVEGLDLGQGKRRCESVDILGHRSLFSDPLVLKKNTQW